MDKRERSPQKQRFQPIAWIGSVVCALVLGLFRLGMEAARWTVDFLAGSGPVALFPCLKSARLLRPRFDRAALRPRAVLRMIIALNLAAPQVEVHVVVRQHARKPLRDAAHRHSGRGAGQTGASRSWS